MLLVSSCSSWVQSTSSALALGTRREQPVGQHLAQRGEAVQGGLFRRTMAKMILQTISKTRVVHLARLSGQQREFRPRRWWR